MPQLVVFDHRRTIAPASRLSGAALSMTRNRVKMTILSSFLVRTLGAIWRFFWAPLYRLMPHKDAGIDGLITDFSGRAR